MKHQITIEMLDAAIKAVGGGIPGALIEKAILEGAFKLVADPKDWRAPISAEIDPATCVYDAHVMVRAVEFFTGAKAEWSDPRWREPGAKYLVKSIGYRAGPCGP